jgi:hypothetical protein
MNEIDKLLAMNKKEYFKKNECPKEITLEMLLQYLNKDNSYSDDKNMLWRTIYHVIFELDKYGFTYANDNEQNLLKFKTV